MLKRVILTLLVLLLLAGAAWYAMESLKDEYTVTYDSYTASVGTISNSLSFGGTLQLVDEKTYTAHSACTVRTVYVKERQQVKKGDRLLRLSNGETITADFDGRINQLYVSEGDEAAAGASLVQLVDFEHMRVALRVDEYDIGRVRVGTPCRVTTTVTSRAYTASIASIDYVSSSTGNVAYYNATAYVNVKDGDYPGMQVTVTIPLEQAENVVVLKADAISFTRSNSAFVYMKDENGELYEHPIEVGVSNGNYVEIRSGLKNGDEVYCVADNVISSSPLKKLMNSVFGSEQYNTGGYDFSGFSGFGGTGSGSFDTQGLMDRYRQFTGGGSGSGGGSTWSWPSR